MNTTPTSSTTKPLMNTTKPVEMMNRYQNSSKSNNSNVKNNSDRVKQKRHQSTTTKRKLPRTTMTSNHPSEEIHDNTCAKIVVKVYIGLYH